jgi:electron transfer flavoprotein beta subunit
MKAKKKPLEVTTAAALGVDIAPRLAILRVTEAASRVAGIRVPSVAALFEKLKNEAKVI